MFNLLLNLTNSFPFSLFILDKNGNIVFMNQSAELFFEHFKIAPLSLTNFKDLKDYFPELYKKIENHFTNIFSGTQTQYGVKFSENYIADITLVPYFEKTEFKNLSVIIEEKTSHYKKINAYKMNSKFLKEVIEIKHLSATDSEHLFSKTISLLSEITNQKKILIAFGDKTFSNNFFHTGFREEEAKSLASIKEKKLFLKEENNLKNYKLTDNIYFIPNSKLKKMGFKLENEENSTLICAISKQRNNLYGIIFIEFKENIIPFVSMLEQLSLFMEFAPLIFGNYEKTRELINQSRFIQEIINGIPESIFVCDADFNIEMANKSAIRNFPVRLIGGNIIEVIGESGIETIKQIINKNMQLAEFQAEEKFFNVSASKIRISKKEKVIIVFSDITEKKKMEEKLMEGEKLKAIKSFCVTANDKINNPLAVMTTKIDILESLIENKQHDTDKLKQITKSIKNQIDKISSTLSLFDSLEKVKIVKYANMETIGKLVLENSNNGNGLKKQTQKRKNKKQT